MAKFKKLVALTSAIIMTASLGLTACGGDSKPDTNKIYSGDGTVDNAYVVSAGTYEYTATLNDLFGDGSWLATSYTFYNYEVKADGSLTVSVEDENADVLVTKGDAYNNINLNAETMTTTINVFAGETVTVKAGATVDVLQVSEGNEYTSEVTIAYSSTPAQADGTEYKPYVLTSSNSGTSNYETTYEGSFGIYKVTGANTKALKITSSSVGTMVMYDYAPVVQVESATETSGLVVAKKGDIVTFTIMAFNYEDEATTCDYAFTIEELDELPQDGLTAATAWVIDQAGETFTNVNAPFNMMMRGGVAYFSYTATANGTLSIPSDATAYAIGDVQQDDGNWSDWNNLGETPYQFTVEAGITYTIAIIDVNGTGTIESVTFTFTAAQA